MFQKREHNITPLYDHHIHHFCDYALLELKGKYVDHWQMNLIFTDKYLERSMRTYIPAFDSFSKAIQTMIGIPDTSVLTNTFRLLLSKTDETLIISKAAMYCIEYLTDRSRTRKGTKRHIQVPEMHRNYRRLRPWRWHRRQEGLYRDITRTPVLLRGRYASLCSQRLCLTTYGRIFAREYFQHHPIYTVHSRPWDQLGSEFHNSDNAREIFQKYCALMEYLITILPRAGRFPPLIHLCRTKSFAPMSMMFQDQSRRTRRAIEAYLCQMDAGVDDDDQGKISIFSKT